MSDLNHYSNRRTHITEQLKDGKKLSQSGS